MIRAVIDPNVLLSALISSSGNEALLILTTPLGLVTPCFSSEILQEYEEVLSRPKSRFDGDQIEPLLGWIRRHVNRFSLSQYGRLHLTRMTTNSLHAHYLQMLSSW